MYLEKYISILDNPQLAESVNVTANSFLHKISDNFDATHQLNALLLGNVQSGKTAQMLGIISAMADKGYRIFFLLTTDNIDLQRQTYLRVKDSLHYFNIINEKEESLLTPLSLSKPTIVVLKKNSRVLSRWKNHLSNTNLCKGMFLVIFDDEADASSLNTLVNRNKVSTMNKKLAEIKKTAASTIYVEVTATPQAVILQSNLSGWKPKFVYYFKPGSNYLGGNFFYPEIKSLNTIYTPEYELDEIETGSGYVCPLGLSRSLMSFLINCAHRKNKGITNCNFMIHPSVKIKTHNAFVSVVQEHLNLLKKSKYNSVFMGNLRNEWRDLQQSNPQLEDFEVIKNRVVEILDNDEILIIPLNSSSFVCRDPNNPDALDLSKGFNIVIGGNTLGRGLTFPNLQTVYYCRSSKTPQADTYWQHSRIFGYDREKQMIRMFIPQYLYKLYADLNAANNLLLKQVEENLNKIQIIYPSYIRPTRKNVVDNSCLNLIQGGINMFDSAPLNINVETINNIISSYSTSPSVDVDADLIIKLLSLVKSEHVEVFNTSKFIACIQGLKAKIPNLKCKLIVRTERDIAKNTGTLLSPNDRALGDSFNNEVVLTMYRIIGNRDKGWDGDPLWIPNIKFPENICFYDMN